MIFGGVMLGCMGYPRKSLVCLNDTPYYHVVGRCVRRAWLWGFDEYAGKDYSHRKLWILERLKLLSSAFAIDLCAYAVMSNHYHLVLHVDRARALMYSREQVVERWGKLFGVSELVERWREGSTTGAERAAAEQQIEQWRARLSDISWYMRCLNEYLARRANAEDGCTGRFWEGRFKSQALLDEAGLLTAMAYVDLNPVRAGMAATPEESEFTSIYARIEQLRSSKQANRRRLDQSHRSDERIAPELLAFSDSAACRRTVLPMRFADYLQLLDWTARAARRDGKYTIDKSVPPILERLSIDAEAWRGMMRPAGNVFGRALGRLERLRVHAETLGQSWIRGFAQAQRMYGAT
jgi:REP element-mobilizing transposase RayT